MNTLKNKLLAFILLLPLSLFAQQPVNEKPRILISTDIGGTDPDDNQSMMHYLLYSNEFDCEGLVSSPSFGDGNKSEILRMIDIYEQDLPNLKKHNKDFENSQCFLSVTGVPSLYNKTGKTRFCPFGRIFHGYRRFGMDCALRKQAFRPPFVYSCLGLFG